MLHVKRYCLYEQAYNYHPSPLAIKPRYFSHYKNKSAGYAGIWLASVNVTDGTNFKYGLYTQAT